MSKLLININNIDEMSKYKEIGISNFLFALKDFSIGYNTFEVSDIPDDAYILINRVMDHDTITKLKSIKDELLKFKGIIFEDIGVYNIFKDNSDKLIWFQNHFGTNYSSINFWLDRVSSCVISNEITKEEIETILNKASKPLVLNVFGKNQIMYSRRTLLSNFNKYNNLDDYNDVLLKENITKNNFFVRENKFGTIIYNNEYHNYMNLNVDEDKILFNLFLNLDLSASEVKDIINGKDVGNDGFLNKKTVYKLKDYTSKGER